MRSHLYPHTVRAMLEIMEESHRQLMLAAYSSSVSGTANTYAEAAGRLRSARDWLMQAAVVSVEVPEISGPDRDAPDAALNPDPALSPERAP